MDIYYHLLKIIARKLGHYMVVLGTGNAEKKCHYAMFVQHSNYDTVLLKVNGKNVVLKYLDNAGAVKKLEIMYEELVRLVYKVLASNGTVSDGKRSLDSSMVPDFMIGCVLSGYA